MLQCNTLTIKDDNITKFHKNDYRLCHVREICSHGIQIFVTCNQWWEINVEVTYNTMQQIMWNYQTL